MSKCKVYPYAISWMYTHQFTFMYSHIWITECVSHIPKLECVSSYAVSWMYFSYSKTWMYTSIQPGFRTTICTRSCIQIKSYTFQNLNVLSHIQFFACKLTSLVLSWPQPKERIRNESLTEEHSWTNQEHPPISAPNESTRKYSTQIKTPVKTPNLTFFKLFLSQ